MNYDFFGLEQLNQIFNNFVKLYKENNKNPKISLNLYQNGCIYKKELAVFAVFSRYRYRYACRLLVEIMSIDFRATIFKIRIIMLRQRLKHPKLHSINNIEIEM